MSDKNKENNKTQKIRLNSPKNSIKIVNKGNCFCLSLQIASSIVELPDNKTKSWLLSVSIINSFTTQDYF